MVYMILIYSHRKKTQQRGQTKKNCPVFRPSGLARLPDEGYGPAPDGYSERLISPCAGSPFYSDRWGDYLEILRKLYRHRFPSCQQ